MSPRDCALAIALPLTREEFLADWRDSERKDFARSVGRDAGPDRPLPARLWKQHFASTARAVTAAAADAERFGARVVRGATLADVGALLRHYRAVTLLTHWKPSSVFVSDVCCPVTVARYVAEGTDEIACGIRVGAPPAMLQQFARADFTASSAELRRNVAEVLRRYVDGCPTRGRAPCATATRFGAYCRRSLLDAKLGNAVRPGCRLELRDALAAAPQLIAQVPETFDGVIDVASCESELLAEEIRLLRPRCTVVASLSGSTVETRAGMFRDAMEALHSRPGSYVDAAARLRRLARGNGKERCAS